MNKLASAVWVAAIGVMIFGSRSLAQNNVRDFEGISVRTVQAAVGKNMHIIVVPLDRFDVRVLTPSMPSSRSEVYSRDPERAAKGYFLEDYKRRFNAVAVLAGGYIDSYSPPTSLGLVRSDGQLISSSRSSWLTEAALCSDAGNVEIGLVDLTRQPFRDCVQAGPLLLKFGKPPTDLVSRKAPGFSRLNTSVQEQNFACTSSDGRVLLGVTDKIDLPTLVTALQKPEVGCVDAIRLTGLDTAGLRIGTTLFGSDDYLYPNVIGVVRRGPE